jgi:CubicO group peptidase (beta-lactamase class C family)
VAPDEFASDELTGSRTIGASFRCPRLFHDLAFTGFNRRLCAARSGGLHLQERSMRHALRFHLSLAAAFSMLGATMSAAQPADLPSGNFLLWQPAQRPSGFSHMEKNFPTKRVKASTHPYPLPRAAHELAVPYTVDGKAMDTSAFMAANNIAGLLVIRDGRIMVERYRLGLTAQGHWNSFSVAKSITSTLVGAAVKDGFIKSLDDPITRYIPGLKGSAYEGVSMRAMLTMSSGARWNENYEDPDSDEMKMKEIDGGKGMAPYPIWPICRAWPSRGRNSTTAPGTPI